MVSRCLAIGAVLVSLCSQGVLGQQGRDAETKKRPIGRVREAVLEAKAAGLSQIEIVPPAITPTGVESLDVIAESYSAALARLVRMVVLTSADAGGIITWYKLKVIEMIIRQDSVSKDPPVDRLGAPPELLPVGRNELLLRSAGGSITLEGVTVKQRPYFHLEVGKEYLLSVFLESSGVLADLAAGPDGVFAVDSEGTLSPLVPKEHPLPQEVYRRHANRLEFVRTFLKEHRKL